MENLIKEKLPKILDHEFREICGNTELQIAVSSDIDKDGNFGKQWLLATNNDIMIFSPNGRGVLLQKRFSIKELSEVRIQSLIGCSAIEALTSDGKLIELLRYSDSSASKFAAAVRWLDQVAKGEKPKEIFEEGPNRCAKCGVILEEGSKVCPRCVQKTRVILRLIAYLKPHILVVFIIGFLILASTGIRLIPPYLTKVIIDQVIVSKDYALLGWIVLGLLAISLAGVGFSVMRGRTTAWLGSRISYEIRGKLYETVQRMSLKFFDKHKTGELISRVSRDTDALQEFLAFEIPFFIVNILMLIGIGAVLINMDWKLAVLTLVPTPLVAFGTLAIWERIRSTFGKVWHRWSQLSSVLNDVLSGIRVVKGFAQEPRELKRFDAKSYDLYQVNMRAEQMWATYMPLLSFLLGTGSLIIWYFGGRYVIREKMTIGTLMAFMSYMGMFYGPLDMVTHIWGWISRSFAAADRIFEIMDMEPEVTDETESIEMPNIKGSVEFQNVTFGYNKHKPVLHNIELNVKPGEMIGFVGKSGVGKTTMTNLICRFYTADEGKLLIDGVDIKKIKLENLRKQIGIVLQDQFLFNGTIAENIAYAKPDATPEEIMQSAKIANAHDFIVKFPEGYDTNVGERGQKLSGGERQRISIARAILHDPKILILDEATSMVDTETEKQIQEALARLVKGRTTFAIAHRLSTLKNADRLVVLEDGKIVEIGTHDELMEKKGLYFKLVEMQTEMSKIKAVDG
ncbi:MAG: ABC transporter ATP-binding protein [bacterium]